MLFESIVEMISSVSNSHAILKVPMSELDNQLTNYKTTLEKEFNQDHLWVIYMQALGNLNATNDIKDSQ